MPQPKRGYLFTLQDLRQQRLLSHGVFYSAAAERNLERVAKEIRAWYVKTYAGSAEYFDSLLLVVAYAKPEGNCWHSGGAWEDWRSREYTDEKWEVEGGGPAYTGTPPEGEVEGE